MAEFPCQTCGKNFSIPDATLAQFKGWTPKQCLACKNKKDGAAGTSKAGSSSPISSASKGKAVSSARSAGSPEAMANVDSGVFTDGAASPNPGPGGWGAVYVEKGQIIAEKTGHEPHTTNNRMELSALIAGYQLVPAGVATIVYSDSELCVRTINEWAVTWQKNGWKKKNGEIKNLELVQQLFALAKARPDIKLQWVRAHAGTKWNEYADRLATSYRKG